jgi:hypothetical protein
MIVERLVIQAKFGQGDALVQGFKDWKQRYGTRYGVASRLLVDVAGPMFTVVAENEYRDLAHVAEMEAEMTASFGDEEWRNWFSSWQGAVESGRRELLKVAE